MPDRAAGGSAAAPGRRGWIAGGIIALLLVAFGVFVLPFAFTTPPPIITRFTSTLLFSPGTPGARDVARVSIRLSEPSSVSIVVKNSSGAVVRTLADGAVVRTKTLSVPWTGNGDGGAAVVPDGTYTIDLEAHAGQKKFSKSRRIVVDTTAPGVPGLTVRIDGSSCVAVVTGPHEPTRLVVTSPATDATTDPRALPAQGTFTWTTRRVASGAQAIIATVSDPAGNTARITRPCAPLKRPAKATASPGARP
ncbi:MAG: hypothetical protein NT143_06240 [Actinobacteria bacterium]|nr:hypothetical protein [Actinomycetota bacterium]